MSYLLINLFARYPELSLSKYMTSVISKGIAYKLKLKVVSTSAITLENNFSQKNILL